MSNEPIDPRDLASGTAVGSASRVGAARYRRRQQAEGAASGAGLSLRRRRSRRNTAIVVGVLAVMFGLLFYLLRFAPGA